MLSIVVVLLLPIEHSPLSHLSLSLSIPGLGLFQLDVFGVFVKFSPAFCCAVFSVSITASFFLPICVFSFICRLSVLSR